LVEIFCEFKKGKAAKKITLEAFLKFLRIEYGVESLKTPTKKASSYSIGSIPKNLLGITSLQNKEIISVSGLKKEIGANVLLSGLDFLVHANTQVAVV